MREIGGYLCLDKCNKPLKHEGAIALNSGRNCLAYLIEKKHIKKIYLPKFLCASVGDVCRRLEVVVEYYSTGKDFTPIIPDLLDGWLYIVNYYGQLNNDRLRGYKEKYPYLIVDNIQAYYQEPCDGIDTIYTCRKFFGVTDGAFLYSDVELGDSLEIDFSSDRIEHIVGSFERGASAYYSGYVASEEEFENMPVRKMSLLTDNLLRAIDYDTVEKKRTDNFTYLYRKLEKMNRLDLTIPTGPYMYPFYIENGAEIRKRLQQKKIFIPTLWPDVFNLCSEDELEYDMAKNILPIPVDQRYGIEDMEYIVEEVLKCID